MAKHARKRQKTSKGIKEVQPLGSTTIDYDAGKDDEERRLESILFGTKYRPEEPDNHITKDEDEEDREMDVGGQEMNNFMNSDLFFIDESAAATSEFVDTAPPRADGSDADEESEEDEHPGDVVSEADQNQIEPRQSSSSKTFLSRSRKPPAWTDPSDPPVVSLSAPRLRKLRDAPTEETLTGREYEARLRRQYERLHPEPSWATKARKAKRTEQDEDEDEEAGLQDLLSTTSGILASSKRKSRTGVVLPAGNIAIERLRDANQAGKSSGDAARVIAFHPSDKIPVLCVGTADRKIRLFNIDGHTNPLLQTLHVPSLPITSPSSVLFHPLGSSLLITGPRPFFYTHDLQSGTMVKHARGLWGTTFSSINDVHVGRLRKRSREDNRTERKSGGGGGEGMEISAFSPHTGDILAVAGRGGYVHLVDWKSGAGQVIGSLKCGGVGGGVRSLWWAPDMTLQSSVLGNMNNTIGSRPHLAVLGGDAEVYLWDVGERRCVKRWKDEGGFKGAGKAMAGSPAGWLAIGSNTGFVNVYGSDSFTPSPLSEIERRPKPVKTIGNLTTSISTLQFNHDGQILAIASKEKKDSMRMIHLPSLTAFSNWPTSSTPLGHVTAVDFSARSDYIAIGNTRGRVLLYHLREYGVTA